MKAIYVARVKNNSDAPVTLPTGELDAGAVLNIFLDFDMFRESYDWLSAIGQGLVFYDFNDGELDPFMAYTAIEAIQQMACPKGVELADRSLWNLEMSNYLLAAVRAETLSTDLSSLGTTWQTTVGKLQSIVGLVQLGMLNEAKLSLLSIPVDGYLTTERLTRWSDFCHSANALKAIA